MKQKILLLSLFLVFSVVLSGLAATVSLALADQINTALEEIINKENKKTAHKSEGDGKLTPLEEEPEGEKIPVDWPFEDKILPFLGAGSGEKDKGAFLLLSVISLSVLLITYFFIKRFKKNRKKRNRKRYDGTEEKKKPVPSASEEENDAPAKGKKLATDIQLNETRRLLQRWETRLSAGRKKKEAETINEWFYRIEGPAEIIPIYEKVRYGEKTCTEEELTFIKMALKL